MPDAGPEEDVGIDSISGKFHGEGVVDVEERLVQGAVHCHTGMSVL